MSPDFESGSLVIAVKNKAIMHEFSEGDDIIFRSPLSGRLNIKRCLAVDDSGIFVTGTNLPKSTDSRHYGRIQPEDIESWVWIKI